MIYVISDLHGYPLTQFKKLLKKAGFRRNDFLFILGDVCDRGKPYGGVDILKWLLSQENVSLLLGNHEEMLLENQWVLSTITDRSLNSLTSQSMDDLSDWIANGAEPTLAALKSLMHTQPETVMDIIEYLEDCPLYETCSIGERDFILTHAGLGNFSPTKRLRDYTSYELLRHRPTLDEKYFDNATVVFGHTPTQYLAGSSDIIFTDSWICIDTSRPTLLRLDDMKEFYIDD